MSCRYKQRKSIKIQVQKKTRLKIINYFFGILFSKCFIDFLFLQQFQIYRPMSRKYKEFPYTSFSSPVSPIINIFPQFDTFVVTNEPIVIHAQSIVSIRKLQSSIFALYCSTRLWQVYNGIYALLKYHMKQFHSPKILCSAYSSLHPSFLQTPGNDLLLSLEFSLF